MQIHVIEGSKQSSKKDALTDLQNNITSFQKYKRITDNDIISIDITTETITENYLPEYVLDMVNKGSYTGFNNFSMYMREKTMYTATAIITIRDNHSFVSTL